MTEDQKKAIDAMDYVAMLRRWRTAPAGYPLFQGECGKYYAKVMKEKRIEAGGAAHTAASKRIGW